jgi:hypothetical protein
MYFCQSRGTYFDLLSKMPRRQFVIILYIILFNKTKNMGWVIKNPVLVTLVLFIFLVLGINYFYENWGENASLYKDNVLIELIVGGGLSLIPLFIGIYVGKKENEIRFYSRIEKFLNTMKRNRIKNNINEKTCREIVIQVSGLFGKEILAEEWQKKVITETHSKDTEDCGVCGLSAETAAGHCINCKLNCFHWKK